MNNCNCDTCRIVKFIEEHELDVYWHEGKPNFNCNDEFAWGCSDCEEFGVEDFKEIKKCMSESIGGDGVLLWIARKRKMRPQGALYVFIDRADWPLFDACGPHREESFGNPVSTDRESIEAYALGRHASIPDRSHLSISASFETKSVDSETEKREK